MSRTFARSLAPSRLRIVLAHPTRSPLAVLYSATLHQAHTPPTPRGMTAHRVHLHLADLQLQLEPLHVQLFVAEQSTAIVLHFLYLYQPITHYYYTTAYVSIYAETFTRTRIHSYVGGPPGYLAAIQQQSVATPAQRPSLILSMPVGRARELSG